MADIFISYKKEDRAHAVRLTESFTAEGFTVWWDDDITPETAWDKKIEQQIADALGVVVLWTPRSIVSDWVRTEAHYAHDRGKLVPVLIEKCDLPLAFMLAQTVDLCQWDGDREDRRWRKLLTWLADLKLPRVASAGTLAGAPANPFRDVIARLPSGEPIVDGSLINAATPAGTLFQDGPDAPIMRVLPAGAFLLGATQDDPDRASYEGPQKRIEIPRPFAIGLYQITRKEYDRFSGAAARPADPQPSRGGIGRWFGRAEKPAASVETADPEVVANNVSFDDAVAFADRLSAALGETYRLPSEAEWEYACRANSRTRYAWGDTIGPGQALYRYPDGAPAGPAAPGRFPANSFGLYDMHGNVRELTADMWHESYDTTPTDGRPALDGHGNMRVVRGGGWSDPPSVLRSAARGRVTQTIRSNVIGLRLVRVLS